MVILILYETLTILSIDFAAFRSLLMTCWNQGSR